MKCSCVQKQARTHLVSFPDSLQSGKRGSGNETEVLH